MAALPLNLSGSSVADGSGLYNTALQFGLASNETLNNAFNTFNKIGQQIGDKNVADAWIQAIAAGKSPNEAITLAARAGNSFTSAEALNRLVAQRNLEQDSLRKEALLDINKAQEERAMQNWLGENEAAEANLLLDTGYNTNNSSVFNQGLSKAAELSDRAKKYIKMQNLADQRDKFANSATSRGYTKALTDQIADKKLASKLDADFKMVRAQNPHMPLVQVAQEVGAMNGLSTEDVTRQLNMHQLASGQDILTEQASNLSPNLTEDTKESYKKAEQNLNDYGIDIYKAVEGNTKQNIEDTNIAIDILSEDLAGVPGTHPTKNETSYYGGGYTPASSRIPKDKAKEIITGLIKNPTPEKLKEVKDYLESNDASGKFIDWLNTNFTVKNNKVTLTPETAEGINGALGARPMAIADGKPRKDFLAANAVTKQRLGISFINDQIKDNYRKISEKAYRNKNELTDEDKTDLNTRAALYNNQTLDRGKQVFQAAAATAEQNPTDSLNKTINTYGDLINSGKHIQKKDLTDRNMDPDLAEKVIKRMKSVKETALSNEEYKNISEEAIELAVLDDPDNAGGWFHFDTDYLKKAKQIDLEKYSKKGQSKLQQQANDILNNGLNTRAQMYLKGIGIVEVDTKNGNIFDVNGNVIGNINGNVIGTN